MARTQEDRIQALMKLTNGDRAEALKMLADDMAIDRGERCDWEPSVEEEKEQRKATKLKVERKPRAKTERKPKEPDAIKREIISKIAEVLSCYEEVDITNVEKTIEFKVGEDTYAIDLKRHRKAKAA